MELLEIQCAVQCALLRFDEWVAHTHASTVRVQDMEGVHDASPEHPWLEDAIVQTDGYWQVDAETCGEVAS
jgi:hypothetical protein